MYDNIDLLSKSCNTSGGLIRSCLIYALKGFGNIVHTIIISELIEIA